VLHVLGTNNGRLKMQHGGESQPQPADLGKAQGQAEQLPLGLVAKMRERTRELHSRAERTGIVNEIIRGLSNISGYKLFLRNLHPAYQQMERGFQRHEHNPALAFLVPQELCRARAIEADLHMLEGPDWANKLPLLPVGQLYAERVAQASEGDGGRLIAHAYSRYLGDLSGGQILKRLLGRSLNIGPEALAFYDFPDIKDVDAFKTAYKTAIDDAEKNIDDVNAVVEEAAVAFELNIVLSDAAHEATRATEMIAP